jgi:hypothetical protein
MSYPLWGRCEFPVLPSMSGQVKNFQLAPGYLGAVTDVVASPQVALTVEDG